MRTVSFARLRPAEIIAERGRCPVLYQPLGPLEWHGPHLPLGTDPLHAEAVSIRAAQMAGGVVMPTLYWGTERERQPKMLRDIGFHGDEWIVGMDFPSNTLPSLYAPEDVFGLIVREQLNLLLRLGFRLILLINGHGATNHMDVLERLAAEYTVATAARVEHILAFAPAADDHQAIGHADALETSLMMALHPDSVDLSTLPPASDPLLFADWAIVNGDTFAGWPTPDRTVPHGCDPRVSSTPERGNASLERSAGRIATRVHELLATFGDPDL